MFVGVYTSVWLHSMKTSGEASFNNVAVQKAYKLHFG